MNKIDKLDKELEKAREKAAEWQAKIRELEKQKQEEDHNGPKPEAPEKEDTAHEEN